MSNTQIHERLFAGTLVNLPDEQAVIDGIAEHMRAAGSAANANFQHVLDEDLYWLGKFILHFSAIDTHCRRLIYALGVKLDELVVQEKAGEISDSDALKLVVALIEPIILDGIYTSQTCDRLERMYSYLMIRNTFAHFVFHGIPGIDGVFGYSLANIAGKKRGFGDHPGKLYTATFSRPQIKRWTLEVEAEERWFGEKMGEWLRSIDPFREQISL